MYRILPRGRHVAAFVAGMVFAGAGAAPAAAAGPSTLVQSCGGSSWFGGSSDVCRGTLVYRDYVNDDYGADTGAALTATTGDLSPSAGDQKYPAGEGNTADLVSLRLSIVHRRLRIRGLLNTLYHPRSTILAVAIDTDHRATTGGGRWPGMNVSSRGWDRIYELRRGNPRTNVIQGSFRVPPGSRWRVQAVTAQSNGTVMNVAFRGVSELAGFGGNGQKDASSDVGSWFEDRQAAALRTGDISAFGASVRVSDLTRRRTRLQRIGPGLHQRVYTSRFTVAPGEGTSDAGVPGRGQGGGQVKAGYEQYFSYLGRYMPYGVYVPRGRPPYGMQMYFHGTGANLTSQINQPGMQARFADGLHRLLIAPEVRGPYGYSSDITERDILDVMRDARATFRVDPRQLYSSGYSQGGYIAYYMAEEYPQLFAGVVSWVGFTGDEGNGVPVKRVGYSAGAVGNVHDFVPNLLDVPTFMLYSGADELVHTQTAVSMRDAFRAAGGIYTWYLHPAAEHLTYIALDDWRKEAADTAHLSLVRNPARVTYVRDPVTDSRRYGIVHDRAYWLSRIANRGAGYGTLDLINHGCGATVPTTRTGSGAGEDPIPWISDYRARTGAVSLGARPELDGTLNNVSGLQIDARATCLVDRPVSYRLTTDGPVALRLSDGRRLTLAGAGLHTGRLAAR